MLKIGAMRRSADESFLYVAVQFYKVCQVTGHAHKKVAVVFRMLLGIAQRLVVNDVDLDMFAHILEIRLNDRFEDETAFFTLDAARIEAQVIQAAVLAFF